MPDFYLPPVTSLCFVYPPSPLYNNTGVRRARAGGQGGARAHRVGHLLPRRTGAGRAGHRITRARRRRGKQALLGRR